MIEKPFGSSLANWVNKTFIGKALRKGFWRQVAILAGGKGLAQVVVILSTPLLTRLFTPADFGILQVYISVTAIILVVASWRYEYAIPLPKDDKVAANLFVLSFAILLLTCGLLVAIILLPNGWLLELLNIESLQSYLWLIPLGVLGGGVYNIFNYWAIRRSQFTLIARTHFVKSFGMVATQLLSGLLSIGPPGLIAGDIIGKIGGVGSLYTQVWRNDKNLLVYVTIKGIKSIAWRYRRFPLISSFSSFLNSVGLNLPALLLMGFYGPQPVGWFALGQRVLNVPLMMVGKGVAQVYLSDAARIAHQGPVHLRKFYLRIALKLFLVGLIPIGVISLAGPWLFDLVFGQDWAQAGVYIQLLFFASLAKFVVNPLSQTLNILERQELQLIWDVGRLITVVVAFALPAYFQWSATVAIGLYSVLSLVTYGLLFWLSLYALQSGHE